MNWCGLGNYAEPELVELNISDDRFMGVGSSSSRKKFSSSENRRKPDADSSHRRDGSSYSHSSSKGRSSSSKGRQSPSYLNPVESSSKPSKAACVTKLENGFNVVSRLQKFLFLKLSDRCLSNTLL